MWYASLLDSRTQFNKGKTCQEIITVSLKIQEAAIKKCSECSFFRLIFEIEIIKVKYVKPIWNKL